MVAVSVEWRDGESGRRDLYNTRQHGNGFAGLGGFLDPGSESLVDPPLLREVVTAVA